MPALSVRPRSGYSFSQAAQDNVGHPASIVLNVTGEHF